MTGRGSMSFGSGICRRMPCTVVPRLSRSTTASSSAGVVAVGSTMVPPAIPASRDAFSFAPTYTALAGALPTSTTLSPGVTPRAPSACTSAATSARMSAASAVPSIRRARVGASRSLAGAASTRKVHRPRFADEHDLDLSGILKLRLDTPSDLLGQRRHAAIVDVVRDDDDTNLAAGLNGKHALDTAVARRNTLESLEALHVGLEGFAPRAGPRSRDGVGSLHEHRHLALVRHVIVVGRDAIHHERVLTVLRGHLDAELHMRALVLVREHLADVVQQRPALRHGHVEIQLRGHDAGEMRDFLRVIQDVLPVTRPPFHAPDELDELRMQSVNASGVRRLLTGLHDGDVDLALRLVDHFLDAPGMDAPVRHELLQREPRHLAPDRIAARHHDGVLRVVDDHVHSRGEFERTDVPSLTPDDPTLHLVVRERHRGHGRFRRGIGGDPLNGEGHDLLCLTLPVAPRGLADLAQQSRGVRLRFLLQAPNQLSPGVLTGHARHLLQAPPLVGHEPLELLLTRLHELFAPAEVAGAPAEVPIPLLHQVELPVERTLALGNAALVGLDGGPSRSQLRFRRLAKLHHLLLAGDDGALARGFDLTLRVSDDAACGLFSGCTGRRLAVQLLTPSGAHAGATAANEKSPRVANEHAQRGNECQRAHTIYAPPRHCHGEKGDHRRTEERRQAGSISRARRRRARTGANQLQGARRAASQPGCSGKL